MNDLSPKRRSSLTTKCQVTIPKDIRDALGLKAGDAVEFELDANGDAHIRKADNPALREERTAKFAASLREARAQFKPLADFGGMDGLEYQRWIRGEGPEV